MLAAGRTAVVPPVAAERSESSWTPPTVEAAWEADGWAVAMCASAGAAAAVPPMVVPATAMVAPMTPVAAAVAAIAVNRVCLRAVPTVAR